MTESFAAILPYALVPGEEGVYVCGCFERWVSIYLQSVRGLNLAWALAESKRVVPGQRVAVIGGGFAGLSVAAGLGRRGAKVTLFERNGELLSYQRHNRVRSIHPHIHEWPRPASRERRAGLPLLDWSAGTSSTMATQVLAGFAHEAKRSRIDLRLGVGDLQLAPGPSVIHRGEPEKFDAVVLALGVGIERTFGALPLKSYWTDDTIAQIKDGPPLHHLVTGVGEGGVIDTLYLRIAQFSHVDIADRLAAIPGMAAVEAELLAIEDEVAVLSDEDANRALYERYLALNVPKAVDDLLAERSRVDTRVTLNGPEEFPLAPRADILNRFLISRLVALGLLEYRSGKVDRIEPDGIGYRVTLDDGHQLRVDEVNVRHGTVPSLATAFPPIWAAYRPARGALPHLVPTPHWPARYFD